MTPNIQPHCPEQISNFRFPNFSNFHVMLPNNTKYTTTLGKKKEREGAKQTTCLGECAGLQGRNQITTTI